LSRKNAILSALPDRRSFTDEIRISAQALGAAKTNMRDFAVSSSQDKNKIVSFGLLFLFLFVYVLTARGRIQNSDEATMFSSLTNLMERGTLAIDELAALNQQIDFRVGFVGTDGHLYSKYSPGNLIAGSLLYWLGTRFQPGLGAVLSLYLNPFLGAIAMVILFKFLTSHYRLETALIVTLMIGFCTDWWYQARGFGLETGGGALLLASLYLSDRGKPAGSAISFGASLAFRTLNGIAWPVWALSWYRSGRRAIWSGVLIGLFGFGLLGYNWLRFGSLTNFGYDNVGFSTPLLVGTAGLFFSPGRSMFIYSPVLILTLPGLWMWIKRNRILGLVLLVTLVSYFISVATWVSWDSGWSWGTRLLTPVLPLMGASVAPVVDLALARKWILIPLAFIGVWGLGVEFLSLARDPLLALKDAVMLNGIDYQKTVYTWNNSWPVLQYRSLSQWSVNDIDALLLRSLISQFVG
jgi:hypothetical protein